MLQLAIRAKFAAPTLTLPPSGGGRIERPPSQVWAIPCRCPLGTVNLARPNDETVIPGPWSWVTQSSLSIVLPAYNEELNIEGAIEEACEVAAAAAPAWEVIVVDDGSRDTTAQRVARISTRQPRVQLISFAQHQGYGAALRAGFRAARGDLIFYTDSDRQFDLSELRYFLPVMERTDVAIGFRVYRYDPVLRCLLSWVYNRLVSAVFRARVRDVDCSFKLLRRDV